MSELNATQEVVNAPRGEWPPDGWFPFGSHTDSGVAVELSPELGRDGLPKWERPVRPGVAVKQATTPSAHSG